MVKYRILQLDFLGVNCILVWDTETRRALIVDPGSSESRIVAAVEEEQLKPEGVLLTHAHVDHLGRVPEITRRYHIPVWLHPSELTVYRSRFNALLAWAPEIQELPEPAVEMPTAGLEFQVIHTPGHTPGGVCYHFPAEKFLLTGDTLFAGSYGRTDFPGGDEEAIFTSIREKLLTLPPETLVIPGHGPTTTIANERHNPLFND